VDTGDGGLFIGDQSSQVPDTGRSRVTELVYAREAVVPAPCPRRIFERMTTVSNDVHMTALLDDG
jgi:hypothetical protein